MVTGLTAASTLRTYFHLTVVTILRMKYNHNGPLAHVIQRAKVMDRQWLWWSQDSEQLLRLSQKLLASNRRWLTALGTLRNHVGFSAQAD